MTTESTTTYVPLPSLRKRIQAKFEVGFNRRDQALIDKRVAAFLRKFDVPGISIAITKDGRLVYAKGFGFAEKPSFWVRWFLPWGSEFVSAWSLVSVWSRFRIASVTKPITSTAIFWLIEKGQLTLNDRIFGPGSILGDDYGYGTLPAGQNETWLGQITVQHLLEHTLGGWPNDSADPMFAVPHSDHKELITWTLRNRDLTAQPATMWAYSNFGYCLLGRIIERRGLLPYPFMFFPKKCRSAT